MSIEYLKIKQKEWDEKARIQEELEIKEEEKRLAKMEAEAREKAAAEARHKRLLQEQEFKRFRQQREKKEKVIYITVAGKSNALSGVVAANSKRPVIACPPFADKTDMMVNIHSTLQCPAEALNACAVI